MLDIKQMRRAPEVFIKALGRRGILPKKIDEILATDKTLRELKSRAQNLRTQKNFLAKKGENTKDKALVLKKTLQDCEDSLRRTQTELQDKLAQCPNLPLDDVPEGFDSQLVRDWGTRPALQNPQPHEVLGASFIDFETARKISGTRFVVLRGPLARLERALGNFMMDVHTREFGYQEISPPLLVRAHSLFGTGQLPKFSTDQFCTQDNLWLIPTSETPLTNLVREQRLQEETLPLRFCALTPCFRREAGAAGRDTRGMIRQHQFAKVELVSITTPAHSPQELERMTACAENILKRLKLPFRVVLLAARDMGFAAAKTYDIEVWLPAQKTYREVSSCSSCTDFQARRINARLPQKFPHTLNGSGLAVGRTLIALLENRQTPKRQITIPSALRPYLDGQDVLDLSDA